MECSATFIVILLSARKFYQTVTPGVLLEVAFHTTKLIYGLHFIEGNIWFLCRSNNPANIYLFKVHNRNKTRCEICSKLTKTILDHRRCSGVFIVNFEYYVTPFFSVSIAELWRGKFILRNGSISWNSSFQ